MFWVIFNSHKEKLEISKKVEKLPKYGLFPLFGAFFGRLLPLVLELPTPYKAIIGARSWQSKGEEKGKQAGLSCAKLRPAKYSFKLAFGYLAMLRLSTLPDYTYSVREGSPPKKLRKFGNMSKL